MNTNHSSNCHCYPILITLLIGFLVTNLRLGYAADSATTETEKRTELSVAPLSHRELLEARPVWVDAVPSRVGELDRLSVVSTPCRSESLSVEGLKVSLRAAVENYIDSITNTIDSSDVIAIDDDWINRHRDKTKNYVGAIKTGDEVMYESAAILQFDNADRLWIAHQWQRQQVSQRLTALGALSGMVVLMLVSVAAALSMVTRRAEQRVVG